MSDKTIVKNVGSKSTEEVAYDLLVHIAEVEAKHFTRSGYSGNYPAERIATREYILDTYVECLKAVSGKRT